MLEGCPYRREAWTSRLRAVARTQRIRITSNEHFETGAADGATRAGRQHHGASKDGTKFLDAECYNRDGHRLVDCRLATFKRLKKRGFIMSMNGGPYVITRAGLAAVRAQLDNR